MPDTHLTLPHWDTLATQADDTLPLFATALLIKAGYGAGPQIALFEKLETLTGTTAMPAWLATHPAATERIAAIRRHLDRWQG